MSFFFHGNEVAKYLEYSNCCSAINKIVNSEDKVTFHDLKTVLGLSYLDRVQFQPETFFINQDRLLDLIMESRMALALQFRKWLYCEVIPSILNTGSYVSPQLVDQLKKDICDLERTLITKWNRYTSLHRWNTREIMYSSLVN